MMTNTKKCDATSSKCQLGQRSSSRVNKLTLSSVLLLALAVSAVISEGNGAPEGAMDRPSNRATTAFVPRLGKRPDESTDGRRLAALGRVLCENSQECSQLALLGALVRDASFRQEPILAEDPQAELSYEGGELGDGLLGRLVGQRQGQFLLRRETRASVDGSSDASNLGNAKRVAFTPRIGRR